MNPTAFLLTLTPSLTMPTEGGAAFSGTGDARADLLSACLCLCIE